MMQWLRDTYNGVYVILLKPYMPQRKTIIMLVGGFLIGLIWAYAIAPTIYYDADPHTLQQNWQIEWVKLLADRNASTANAGDNIVQLLHWVDDPVGIITNLLNDTSLDPATAAKLNAIMPYAQQAEPTAIRAPSRPNFFGSIAPFIVGPIVLVVVGVIVALVWGLLIYGNLVEPVLKRLRGEKESPEVAAEKARRVEQRAMSEKSRTDFTATSYGPPIIQKMSNYTQGFGAFDDSFSIEDADERFFGECGAGISETIGVGDPQKVTAIEVWLFDKDDFVRTVTHVLASEHAFNDPGLRAKLEPKGEIVMVQPGATTVLETKTLRLQARVVDVTYGAGPLPPNSFFEKMAIEIAVWRKQADAVPAGAPSPATATATVPAAAPPAAASSFAPPPPAPMPLPQTPPPAAPGPFAGVAPLRPATAPPPAPTPPRPMTPPPEDDPFGGTGDFTPVS